MLENGRFYGTELWIVENLGNNNKNHPQILFLYTLGLSSVENFPVSLYKMTRDMQRLFGGVLGFFYTRVPPNDVHPFGSLNGMDYYPVDGVVLCLVLFWPSGIYLL